MAKKAVTAEELVNQLQSDPGYQKRMIEKKERLRKKAEVFRQSEQPVIKSLQDAGYDVSSLDELVNTKDTLPNGIVQILLEQIPLVEDKSVLGMIIRSISAAQKCSFDGRVLTERFDRTEFSDDELRWVIANAIEATLPTHITDWVAQTVKTSKYYDIKGMLCEALIKMTSREQSLPLILSVFDQCPSYVAAILKKYGSREHLDFLRSKESVYITKTSTEKRGTLRYNAAKLALKEIQKAIIQIKRNSYNSR